MVKLNVNVRFAVISLETHAARRHAEVGLRRLAGMEKGIRDLVLEELKASGYADDEVERSIAHQEIYYLEDELPRLEVYGILFVLFATFESVVKRLPRYVGNWKAEDVTASKGDALISKAARFYRDELGVALFSNSAQEDFVRTVADVRNAVAHATGQRSMLKARLLTRLEAAIAKDNRLSFEEGALRIELTYVRDAARVLNETTRDLIDRLKEAHPSRRTATPSNKRLAPPLASGAAENPPRP